MVVQNDTNLFSDYDLHSSGAHVDSRRSCEEVQQVQREIELSSVICYVKKTSLFWRF